MKKSYIVLAILAIVIFSAGGWMKNVYNGIQVNQEVVKEKWSNVEVQYQRRIDLIPSLVKTAQGVADFEKTVLTDVTAARSAWAQAKSAGDRPQQVAAASSFDSAISRLLVTVEAYPQLKATEAFTRLQTELTTTENKVAQARRMYNVSVKDFNTHIAVFPNNLLAGLFGASKEKPFEASAGSEKAPEVNFGSN